LNGRAVDTFDGEDAASFIGAGGEPESGGAVDTPDEDDAASFIGAGGEPYSGDAAWVG
jgi:hypothetical protein